MAIIFRPQGVDTNHKIGTILVGAPKSVGTGAYSANYKIDSYPHAIPGPPTGEVNAKYSGRFDDPKYYF